MEKVVLVYPRRDGRIFGKAPGSPYTLMRLASLVPPEIPVEIWDENVADLDYSRVNPGDLVGITSMTLMIDRARIIAEQVQRRGGKAIVGGVHATLAPDEVGVWADSVNVGEAYHTWPRIIADHLAGSLQPIYRDESWASLKGIAPISDRVIDVIGENERYWTPYLEITRGCPRDCAFCTAIRVSGRVMRHRPPEEVVDEITRRGIRRFFLTDDNFGLNFRTDPAYMEQVFRALRPLPLQGWTAQAELIVAKYPDLLDMAREAHLDKFFIGFESINPRNKADLGGKARGKLEEYRDVIRTVRSHGIGVVGLFVLGLEHDTPETFEETWNFIRDSELDSVSVTFNTPFPGTPERDRIVNEGRLLNVPWSHYDTAHVTFRPFNMSVEEARDAYNWICNKVYSPHRIAQRGLRSLRRYPIQAARRKMMGSFGTDFGYWRTYRFRHVA